MPPVAAGSGSGLGLCVKTSVGRREPIRGKDFSRPKVGLVFHKKPFTKRIRTCLCQIHRHRHPTQPQRCHSFRARRLVISPWCMAAVKLLRTLRSQAISLRRFGGRPPFITPSPTTKHQHTSITQYKSNRLGQAQASTIRGGKRIRPESNDAHRVALDVGEKAMVFVSTDGPRRLSLPSRSHGRGIRIITAFDLHAIRNLNPMTR